jgi:hypothetical protein
LIAPNENDPEVLSGTGFTKLNGGFTDSAFADNKQKPLHRWVPWIAGFSAEFVPEVFDRYLPDQPRKDIMVLGPFCGVGTTLIEALLRGHNAIGFEINPYAALASRAKLEAASIGTVELQNLINSFESYMGENRPAGRTSFRPIFFKTRIPFFGGATEVKVLRALHFIHQIPAVPIRDLFSLALGSVMVSLSNYSYEPSLSSRPAAGKPVQEDTPVGESIYESAAILRKD